MTPIIAIINESNRWNANGVKCSSIIHSENKVLVVLEFYNFANDERQGSALVELPAPENFSTENGDQTNTLFKLALATHNITISE